MGRMASNSYTGHERNGTFSMCQNVKGKGKIKGKKFGEEIDS